MRTLLIAAILSIAAFDEVEGQDRRYERYGSDLYRVPGYGTLEVDRYRGESYHNKRNGAESWFYRRRYERRPTGLSRPGRGGYYGY